MNVTTGVVTTSDGVRLAYDVAGDGPAVVFVHGLGLSRLRWRRPYGAAARAGHTCVRWDLRGFGGSDPPSGPYAMSRLVSDLAELVDHLGFDRLHLVGHSLGGMIALAFAVERPERVRSLTLASTTARTGARTGAFAAAASKIAEEGFERAVADPHVRALVDEALSRAFPSGGAPSIEQVGAWLGSLGVAEAYAWRASIGFDVVDRLGTLVRPSLVLHGTADLLVPFRAGERLAEALPDARFVAFEGAGHSIQVERGEDFARELVAHLTGARR